MQPRREQGQCTVAARESLSVSSELNSIVFSTIFIVFSTKSIVFSTSSHTWPLAVRSVAAQQSSSMMYR